MIFIPSTKYRSKVIYMIIISQQKKNKLPKNQRTYIIVYT